MWSHTFGQVLALCLLISACSKSSTSAADAGIDHSRVVAMVGEQAISVDDFEARVLEQPEHVRAQFRAPERQRALVEAMIQESLLVAEARRRGLENDAQVRMATNRALIQRVLQLEVGELKVTEQDSRAFYAAHVEEFERPERIRVAHFFIKGPIASSERNSARALAQRELASVLAKPEGERAASFSALIRRASTDEASKPSEGDLGPRTRLELEQQWGAPVAQAAFALTTVGQISPLIESDRGFHALRLVGRQPELKETWEQARPRIDARLGSEARSKKLEQLQEGLRKSVQVQLHLDRLTSAKASNSH